MAIPKGLGWLIAVISFLERTIERFLKFISNKKDNALVPFIQAYWPRWLLPNHLTAIRFLLAIGIIFWLILTGGGSYQNNSWLLVVVIVAVLTDFLDGPVARTLEKESKLGSLLDKVVDKFLILPLGTVEFWPLSRLLVVLSIAGTIIVLAVSLYKYFQSEDSVVPENVFGKTSMTCYSLAIVIAIWPAWQNIALGIAWTGFFFALSSMILNFYRHFELPGLFKY